LSLLIHLPLTVAVFRAIRPIGNRFKHNGLSCSAGQIQKMLESVQKHRRKRCVKSVHFSSSNTHKRRVAPSLVLPPCQDCRISSGIFFANFKNVQIFPALCFGQKRVRRRFGPVSAADVRRSRECDRRRHWPQEGFGEQRVAMVPAWASPVGIFLGRDSVRFQGILGISFSSFTHSQDSSDKG